MVSISKNIAAKITEKKGEITEDEVRKSKYNKARDQKMSSSDFLLPCIGSPIAITLDLPKLSTIRIPVSYMV